MTRIHLFGLLTLFFSHLQAAGHCVILQYHHFSAATPSITSVTPEQFDAHLDYLEDNDFKVMDLQDVALALYHQRELPDKCVSLSVDDAYLSVYETAYPRVRERGWPLTVFVNSESVDNKQKPFMSWPQMREMARHGIRFQNHGHSHMHMIRRKKNESETDWLQRVKTDIQTAQRRISDELGQSPRLFAWPYGEYNRPSMQLLQDMGFIGFGQQSGPAWADANFAALPRFPMADRYADLAGFITKVNTLPLPVVKATPAEPVTAIGDRRPTLTLTLAPKSTARSSLRCYASGSDRVQMDWDDQQPDVVRISPLFDLSPGRHRVNCTMPSSRKGRFHWYSHNWFMRNADGSWYAEY